MRGTVRDRVLEALGDEITDAEEESFLVFSQSVPSQNLGFVDSKAATLDLSIAGRDLTIHQSPGLLSSNRDGGTTGAVVWRVTPLFAEWVASSSSPFAGLLDSSSTVLELGTGVSGAVALALAPEVGRYIATDQDYVLKLLRRNVDENTSSSSTASSHRKGKKITSSAKQNNGKIELLALDWETSSIASLPQTLHLGEGSGIDMVIACDCIYNEYLVEPFVETCAAICALAPASKPTLCVVAQQLRSPDVFELWMKRFHRSFRGWRVPDNLLTSELRDGSGFVVHIGILR